jgi:PA domain
LGLALCVASACQGAIPALPSPPSPPREAVEAARAITPELLRDQVTRISADAFEGRAPSTPGDRAARAYLVEAPEYRWDDFKGRDVRGKVLLILNNDPDWDPALFAGTTRLYYGRWTYKFENAARHGAAGALLVHTKPSAGYPL